MINPIRLCDDLFNDNKLSDIKLRPFTEIHLVRLANNNPGGIYSTLISDTTTKYTAFYGRMSNEAAKDAISQGLTITMNNAREAILLKLDQMQGLVKYKFGETSAVYQEFYPHGMLEYTRARVDEIAPLLDRFMAAATTHLNTDFPLEVADANTKTTAFKTARNAQVTSFAEIDTIATGRHEDRKILTEQLTYNFLTIAANNIDNPDRFDDYYDARYLPLSESDVKITLEDSINPGQPVSPDTEGIALSIDTILRLQNTGSSTLRFYFTNTENGYPVTAFIDLAPGGDQKQTATELGFSETEKTLTLQNIGGTSGSYKITIG